MIGPRGRKRTLDGRVCDVTHFGKVAEARLFQEVRAGKLKRCPEEQVVSGEEESQFELCVERDSRL